MKRAVIMMFRAVFLPWKNIQMLEKHKSHGLWTGALLGLLTLAAGLAITSFVQAASGNFPAAPTFLPFSLENYFFWQSLLVIPWILAGWVLISFLSVLILSGAKVRKTAPSPRQLSSALAISFYPFLFWLFLSHLLTAIFYTLGMSQKEWVDLISEPGWFQSMYIFLLVMALFSGLFSSSLTLSRMVPSRRMASGLLGVVFFLLWSFMILFLLR